MTGVKIPALHPNSWASDIIEGKMVIERDASIIVLCGVWAVWSERNARHHGEKGRHVMTSVKWTVDLALDLTVAGDEGITKSPRARAQWKPLDQDVLKISVDACFIEELHQGSTGVGVKDHAGVLIRAQALWYANAANPMVMEAQAIRDDVRLACDNRKRCSLSCEPLQ